MGRGEAEFAVTLGIHVPYTKLEGLHVTCPHDDSERPSHFLPNLSLEIVTAKGAGA